MDARWWWGGWWDMVLPVSDTTAVAGNVNAGEGGHGEIGGRRRRLCWFSRRRRQNIHEHHRLNAGKGETRGAAELLARWQPKNIQNSCHSGFSFPLLPLKTATMHTFLPAISSLAALRFRGVAGGFRRGSGTPVGTLRPPSCPLPGRTGMGGVSAGTAAAEEYFRILVSPGFAFR